MNIQDEIKNDRLVLDFAKSYAIIRKDLYGELLDTSMFPHSLKVMRMAWWKRCLLWLFSVVNHIRYEQLVLDVQWKFYLNKMLEYVNDERVRVLGMKEDSVSPQLDFSIADEDGKPLYVGVYVGEKNGYFMRVILNDNLNPNLNNGDGND